MHVVRSANVRYSKVRPLHPLCQFDVCRHEVRYGCQREDSCSFAHSVIELKCWVLQQDTGTEDTHVNVFMHVHVVCFKGIYRSFKPETQVRHLIKYTVRNGQSILLLVGSFYKQL